MIRFFCALQTRRPRDSRTTRPKLHLFVSGAMAFLISGTCGAQQAVAQAGPQSTLAAPDASPMDRQTRAAVLHDLFAALDRYYVFPGVAQEIRQNLSDKSRRGNYDALTDPTLFAEAISRDLRQVGRDPHLGISYSATPVPADPVDAEAEDEATLEQHRAFGRRVNFGFSRVEILPGEVGYLKLDGFFDLSAGGTDTAAAAMAFVRHTRALIIDLRENGGGHPSMGVLLLSYFFSNPTHLSDFHRRDDARVEQNWTAPFVPGAHYTNPVYVLTSRETISAPEGFAYDLQTRRRAVIVGETTAGAANPGYERRIGEHFTAFIPFGRAVSPVTGTNWEGTGVTPDLPATANDALSAAQRAVLQAAIANEGDSRQRDRLRAALTAVERQSTTTQPRQP